jgi:anti-sigma regulatory factor (Ser/Thr protein kinase)
LRLEAMMADHGEFRGDQEYPSRAWGSPGPVRLKLPAAAQAVRLARQAARDALAGWQLEDLAEPAVLIVSELVTNAVRHAGKTGTITLELTSAGTCLHVEVLDADPRWPQLRSLDDCDESGFGLILVAALTTSWGVRQTPRGKAVWAELDALRC